MTQLESVWQYSLFDALQGRRSRRVAAGVSIPSGPFEYEAKELPQPLNSIETSIILSAMTGVTGWHHLMEYSPRHAGKIPSYATGALGRTSPSSGGWFATRYFFTDDTGVYYLRPLDAPRLQELRVMAKQNWAISDFATQISPGRLKLPARFISGHNRLTANVPGSLLIMPVCDLAHVLLELIAMAVTIGSVVYDDVAGRAIPDLEAELAELGIKEATPLSRLEQNAITLAAAEMAISCQNALLVLQAIGLGGWLFAGVNSNAILGGSGDPEVPGLGFQCQSKPEWSQTNCTGLPGYFPAHCPPNYADMGEALDDIMHNKFGPNGPYNPSTPGPYGDNAGIRGAAYNLSSAERRLVAKIANYIFRSHGKFPVTAPTMYLQTVVQAHHISIGFYDRYMNGGYLDTHRDHQETWHR